ncbi:MAG: indolepyruvate ferredoxin oxidoreductase family protein, partial [Ilumatobacteraceae bacterium]
HDEQGRTLLAAHGALDADAIVAPLRSRLATRLSGDRLAPLPVTQRSRDLIPLEVNRTPYFCSGCPHNTSTRVPDGALVGGGIGCHSMVAMMDPQRVGELVGLTCMGNEGAQWVGMAPFVETNHLIQNLGDGTYAHSGQLAVRWAVAAGINITYKILANGVVAMTGGQDPQGAVDVPTMAQILLLQGVRRVIITTEDLGRDRSIGLGKGAEVWDRSRIIEAQEVLAAIPGTTVLIHDQYCAAENRRLRKREKVPTPSFRVLINERVCEGCGDCGQKSNCLSVQPVETEFGRKTRIDQSSCNLDFSCLDGDCPSFATVRPARRRFVRPGRVVRAGVTGRRGSAGALSGSRGRRRQGPASLPVPTPIVRTAVDPAADFVLRMSGIGGTGVVTVSQIVATAAMLQGYTVRGLDQTGLSQKAGPVVSDLCLTRDQISSSGSHGSNKAATGEVDVMLAFDLLAAASDAPLNGAAAGRTVVIGSASETPTGNMVLHPDVGYPGRSALQRRLDASSRAECNRYVPVNELVTGLFGDNASANVFLVGVAVQAGALPIDAEHLERAIELNGVAVEGNLDALRWGRLWVVDPETVTVAAGIVPAADPCAPDSSVAALVARRAADLVEYQSPTYCAKYLATIEAVRSAGASSELLDAVARNLFKLMAYKDEYEVARLLLAPAAREAAERVGGRGARVTWRLHPPLLRALGMQNKLELGRWATPALVVLRAGRRLRGTPFDLAGYSTLRRTERALATEYAALMTSLVRSHEGGGVTLLAIANLPDMIRGYESIKERNIEAYRTHLAELLATLDAQQSRRDA